MDCSEEVQKEKLAAAIKGATGSERRNTGKPVTIPSQVTEGEIAKKYDQGAANMKKRTFDAGATRDTEQGKLDFEGFLSPLVLVRYAEYLDSHRTMKDGSIRDSDNWQKGIPLDVYMKSEWRHHWDMWAYHRGWLKDIGDGFEDAMCAILFNVSGYLHERLKKSLAYRDNANNIDAMKDAKLERAEKAFDEADLASQKSEGLSVTEEAVSRREEIEYPAS